MMQKISLTIKLIKGGHTVEECLKEKIEPEKKYGGHLVIKSTPSKVKWASFLEEDLSQSSHGAVLFVEAEQRIFALCFGFGHYLLKPDSVEEKFGIRVASNALDKNKLKSTDVFSPSDHSKQRRTQTTKNSNLQTHDFDGYTHVLKKITGTVKQEYEEHLCKNITAGDGVKISTDLPASEMNNLCKTIFKLYQKNDHKDNFPEFFHMQDVRDAKLINNLDNKLVNSIKNNCENIYITIPELIDFQEVSAFKFNLKDRKNHPEKENLDMSDLYSLIENIDKIDKKNLNEWRLVLLDDDGNKKMDFPIYKTLVYDCVLDNENYHFTHGCWYKVDSSFLQKISEELESIKKDKISGIKFPEFNKANDKNEEVYNRNLAESLHSSSSNKAFCLDRQCIPISGYDKIEPCDVLLVKEGEENYYIHVKRKHGGSSDLSHLFNQGDVSLTLLNNKDKKFMQGLIDKTNMQEKDLVKNPHVHFLILDNSNSQRLPLFSKITLYKTVQSIRSKGGKPSWAIVKESS